MGLFRKWARRSIGLGGQLLMGAANAATGGLAGKLADNATGIMKNQSGLIGKTMGSLGKAFLSDNMRNKISNVADAAIKYIPKGNVREALTKINNHAQGRDENYKMPKPAKTTESSSSNNAPAPVNHVHASNYES